MAIATNHPKNDERLAALRDYDILDTDHEAAFDEVARLAARLCDTPVATVTLIDEERQWHKSAIGLDVRETPLDISICAHAILEQDFLEIPDLLDDERTRDNPLCQGAQGARFYAGALLSTADGLPIGTLCVIDLKPRVLTDLQREAIRVLAIQVMRQLDLRRALKRQDVLRQEIDHRVKNSLQSVSAIISLEGARSGNAEVTRALATVQQRLNAVVALHAEIHLSGEGARVQLGRFVDRLSANLSALCPPGVAIDARAGSIDVDAAQASAIGMIVNEFVANAVKHAYPDGQGGTIRIVGAVDGDHYRLTCSDGGIGLADAAQVMRRGSGLGLRIIAASASTLDATPLWSSGADGLTLGLAFRKLVTPTGLEPVFQPWKDIVEQ